MLLLRVTNQSIRMSIKSFFKPSSTTGSASTLGVKRSLMSDSLDADVQGRAEESINQSSKKARELSGNSNNSVIISGNVSSSISTSNNDSGGGSEYSLEEAISSLNGSWKELLNDEFNKPYFRNLASFIQKESNKSVIYPPNRVPV